MPTSIGAPVDGSATPYAAIQVPCGVRTPTIAPGDAASVNDERAAASKEAVRPIGKTELVIWDVGWRLTTEATSETHVEAAEAGVEGTVWAEPCAHALKARPSATTSPATAGAEDHLCAVDRFIAAPSHVVHASARSRIILAAPNPRHLARASNSPA
ncbi:hypothetical protein [Subtercola frigoramans]|uniref:Uncharacterized protein n=1 Tax=Subtercola frigoramans TaxID=120298 RepID=A0ABS2L475_9MICO|nr:hypothetical protein [Subtercola frigoramans]MBM7471545.1 hypothetical protein [Subtercola frigoramans]